MKMSEALRIGLVLALLWANVSAQSGVGFELLFTTNNRSFYKYKVSFNGEIPKWIRGSLVGGVFRKSLTFCPALP